MIKNYLLTAWRNLRTNRFNAIINIAGLTVAFTVGMLLFLLVHFEFSYDRMHVNGEHLFQAYAFSHAPDGEKMGTSLSYPAGPAMRAEVPGIIRTSVVVPVSMGIRYKGKELDKTLTLVDNDFFSMFSFPIVAGSKTAPLAGIGDIVLSQALTEGVFGKEDPVGKMVTVKVGNEWKDLRVSAVIADAPTNSTIQYSMLARIENFSDYTKNKDNWDAQSHRIYVQTASNVSQEQVEAGMRVMMKRHHPPNVEYLAQKGYRKDAHGEMEGTRLAPLFSLHFNVDLGNNMTTSKSYLYILILIAIVVLAIACFNFINLNVARAFTRAREVGVRKTIGAGRGQIFVQLWMESLLLFVIAVVFSVIIAGLLLKPFNDLFVEKMTLSTLLQPGVLGALVVAMVVVSFLAGGYPAWMVSRFNTVEVLKGRVTVKRSGLLRNGLITFQFVMACLLICGTIVIYQQFEHMRTAPMGYVQESVISIPVKHGERGKRTLELLRQKLASQPQVLSVAGSSINIGIGMDHSESQSFLGFTYNSKMFESELVIVDYDFLDVMGIKPIAGRGFSRDFASDTASGVDNVVVTESMAKQFTEKNVVGLSLATDTTAPKWRIIGVVPDLHMHSVREKTHAVTFSMAKNMSDVNYILVKTRDQNPVQTMAIVAAAYKQIEPDNTVDPTYVTENTSRWYNKERRLSAIFCSAAVIAVFLSCLGLFAIVSLVIGLRRKEIGVRKVLGASVPGIAGLLSKDFMGLVMLAFVIASPLAWYLLHSWLEDFTYRIAIQWWVFPLAGLAALMIALCTISVLTIRASMSNPVKNLRTE